MSARKLSEQELRESAKARLEKYSHHVPFSACVFWAGATNEHGYGVMGIGREIKAMKSHRVAYALRHGLPLEKRGSSSDEVLRHICDNPACVNTEHLIPGNQHDNIQDTVSRDRVAFGSRHHSAKLSEEDVAHILAMKGRETQSETAKRYGVYPSVISRIYGGHAWARASKGDIS